MITALNRRLKALEARQTPRRTGDLSSLTDAELEALCAGMTPPEPDPLPRRTPPRSMKDMTDFELWEHGRRIGLDW